MYGTCIIIVFVCLPVLPDLLLQFAVLSLVCLTTAAATFTVTLSSCAINGYASEWISSSTCPVTP